jgi:hypothetical protein
VFQGLLKWPFILAYVVVDVLAQVVVDPLRVRDLPHQALYQGFEEAGG